MNTTLIAPPSVVNEMPLNRLSLTIEKHNSILNCLTLHEEIDVSILDKLINSKLLKNEFHNPLCNDKFVNERDQLEKYKKLIKKGTSYAVVKYKKSKGNPFGRCNPENGLGLFNIRREIRQTLCKDLYVDIDIKNAHPTMLLQIMDMYSIPCPLLKEYVNERQKWFDLITKNYNCSEEQAKKLMILYLYGGGFDTWVSNEKLNPEMQEHKALTAFKYEVRHLQTVVKNANKEIEKVARKIKNDAGIETFNIDGTVCSYFLQEYECRILEVLYKYCVNNNLVKNKVIILCADGLMIRKDFNVENLLQVFNDIVKKDIGFNLIFTNKEMTQHYLDILDDNLNTPDEIEQIDNEKTDEIKNKFYKLFEDGFIVDNNDDNMARLFKKLCFNNNLVFTGSGKEPNGYIFNGVYWNTLSYSNCELMKGYFDKLKDYITIKLDGVNDLLKQNGPSGPLGEMLNYKVKTLTSMVKRCGSYTDRSLIIKILKSECFVSNIEWDNNPYLFAFNNKIYDFSIMDWVEPKQEQYITITTGFDYVEPDDNNVNALNKMLSQIFTNEDVKKDALTTLSTGLVGLHLQHFIIATGIGGNGKSLLHSLFMSLVGSYGYKLPSSILLQEAKNGANPELANLHKKRFVLVQEPSSSLRIKTSMVKELTGDTSINARKLYSDNCNTSLALTFVMEANTLPKLDCVGQAEARRIRATKYTSLFVPEHELSDYEGRDNVFVGDPYYTTDEWKILNRNALFTVLLEYFKLFRNNSYKLLKQPADSLEIVNYYLSCSDDLFGWFNDTFTLLDKDDDACDPIPVKEVFSEFKNSGFYNNLSKSDKRAFNYAKFQETITQSLFLRKYIKDRKEYYNNKQLTCLSVVGWRYKKQFGGEYHNDAEIEEM